MAIPSCPRCGHQPPPDATACPGCGQALAGACETATLATQQAAETAQANGVASGKPSAELMSWARQNINEEEVVAEIRQIRQTGGVKLEDFIGELEAKVTASE